MAITNQRRAEILDHNIAMLDQKILKFQIEGISSIKVQKCEDKKVMLETARAAIVI